MNNLENIKKGDVIKLVRNVPDDTMPIYEQFLGVIGYNGTHIFTTGRYGGYWNAKNSIAISLNHAVEIKCYPMRLLERYSATIYTPEPEIKYWSNGAVRSGMKEWENYYFIDTLGCVSHSHWGTNDYSNFRLSSKMIFLDENLCKTHRQEILDRQAIEQKVWEIMDGQEKSTHRYWDIYLDEYHKWRIRLEPGHSYQSTLISHKASEYLLSDEVTDYQRALWIEDWELAREYKSKE